MHAPFPGMDPFLENRFEWPSVHTWLITEIASQLGDDISPDFFVRIEQRVYITAQEQDNPEEKWQMVPDIFIATEPVRQLVEPVVATAAVETPTLVEPVYDLEIRDRYIEIRDTLSREVVTTIELLSPFNKALGHEGYDAFQKKRRQVMASKVHWLEIDLLRAGERPEEVAGKSDYYALLKRGGQPGPYEVWYFDMRDRLPTIGVPLRPPFADVALDLQSAFTQLYGRAHYADSLDYTRAVPQPQLRPANANWVQTRIQTWLQERANSP